MQIKTVAEVGARCAGLLRSVAQSQAFRVSRPGMLRVSSLVGIHVRCVVQPLVMTMTVG